MSFVVPTSGPGAESSDELAAWLRLALTPGLGPVAARGLLQGFGLPEDILRASPAALAHRLRPEQVAALRNPDALREQAVERALCWATEPGNHVLTLADPRYPQRLLQTADPPVLLYVQGDPACLDRAALAIVGSRSASAAGTETARAFARALADAGLLIVSGLARGIDAAAHDGGLAGIGGSLAVLGTGVDLIYPRQNLALAQALLAGGGALVSEQPLGTGPRRASFPRRNRLIAGMSLGVLVVEAALRSGSLITARQAVDCGREVFAIPGSIHSPLAKGCHALIKQGAKLVESVQDILDELSCQHTQALARRTPAPPGRQGRNPADQDPLLRLLGWEPAGIDDLVARGAGDSRVLAARLLELELAGSLIRTPDGRYQRCA